MSEQSPQSDDPRSAMDVWVVCAQADARWADVVYNHLQAQSIDVRRIRLSAAMGRIAWSRVGGSLNRLRRMLPGSEDAATWLDTLSDHRPRLIVVRDVEVGRTFGHLRLLLAASFGILAIVDTFTQPHEWAAIHPDFVVIPTEAQRVGLDDGIAADRLRIAGPFAPFEKPDAAVRATVREAMGLGEDAISVLVDASNLTPGRTDELVSQLALVDTAESSPAWCFYDGGDDENAQMLRACARARGLRAKMFGDSGQLRQVLAGADLVVVGAVGEAMLGAAYLRKPLMGVGAHWMDHALVRCGAMMAVSDVRALSHRIDTYIGNGGDGSGRDAESVWGETFSDDAVCEAIDALIAHAATLEDVRAAGDGGSPDVFSFEEIGVPRRTSPSKARAPISARQARDEMARLLLEQRRLQQQHAEAIEHRDLWLQRVRDAELEQEEDLRKIADQRAQYALREVAKIQHELDVCYDAKDALRSAQSASRAPEVTPVLASDAPDASVERRFRQMAERRELRALRQRAKDDRNGGH